MRVPWDPHFPDVLVHCHYHQTNRNDTSCLKANPHYTRAKECRDVHSAISLINDVANEQVIDGLKQIAAIHNTTPILIAPAAQIGDSQNALAISYAQWLGYELDWPVEERVFQSKVMSKDRQRAWFRLAHPSSFYGQIDKSTPYVIVDDVITLGGTLADLRSFILSKGGSVIGMSAIASRDGTNQQIRLGDDKARELERFYGRDVAEFCVEILGYTHLCLTRPEAKFLLGRSGHVECRKAIQRERDKADAQRRPRRAG